jgi:hypothetical protein
MNQISLYEQKELTAFGLFNLNLRLITSVSIFLNIKLFRCYNYLISQRQIIEWEQIRNVLKIR